MDYRGALGGRRLLLVDDDVDLRESLSEMLRADGYEIVVAGDGSEGLASLRRGPPPDLILLDLVMPVKDGWQFRIEQKQDPSIAMIPVLAMSADDTPQAAAIDADQYIKKPFHYSELSSAIQRIVEHRRILHLDRMASLGTLAAGIAHEINNPLTYVIANLQIVEHALAERPHEPRDSARAMLDEAAEDDLRARLRDALDGAERIRNIVLDVKTFSGAADDRRMLVDVRGVIDAAIRVVYAEIRHKAKVVKEYGPAPLVMANSGQLGQVFVNLLLNAADAVGDGRPDDNVIRIVTSTSPSDDAVIEFSDSGAGIPPDVQHRIFDPFFTTRPIGVGTGLGLSICHGIVKSLGGDIAVKSTMGRGTTFRIALPSSAGAPSSSRPVPPLYTARPPLRARVLIIDDEPQLAHVIELLLQPDHDTSISTTCTEALDILTSDSSGRRFDAILCDLHMPGTSGMDLHEQLSRTRPDVADRMIFMTGGTFTPKSREFAGKVKNPCVDKPIDIKKVRSIIAALAQKAG
jgi:signal transduction histidine kinase